MTYENKDICPEGWDPSEILAYIEGELDPEQGLVLNEHLQRCKICAAEFHSLSKIDSLLKQNPEALHPDKEELFQFVMTGQDPDHYLEQHVELCDECKTDLDILKEMISVRSRTEEKSIPIPEKIIEELDKLYNRQPIERPLIRVLKISRKLFRFRSVTFPLLTLSTAAAVLIVAILIGPIWNAYNQIPEPRIAKESQMVLSPSELEQPTQDKSFERPAEISKHVQDGDSVAQERKQREALPMAPTLEKPSGYPHQDESISIIQPSAPDRLSELKVGKNAFKQKKEIPRYFSPDRRYLEGEAKDSAQIGSYFKREKASPASSITKIQAQSRTPIEVQITDSMGNDIKNLHFNFPSDAQYLFYRTTERNEAPVVEQSSSLDKTDSISRGYRLKITVSEKGEAYDLLGEIFQAGKITPEKTIKFETVSGTNLEAQIEALISVLTSQLDSGKPKIQD